MKRFIESDDPRQATLLPDSLEDYVTGDLTAGRKGLSTFAGLAQRGRHDAGAVSRGFSRSDRFIAPGR